MTRKKEEEEEEGKRRNKGTFYNSLDVAHAINQKSQLATSSEQAAASKSYFALKQ